MNEYEWIMSIIQRLQPINQSLRLLAKYNDEAVEMNGSWIADWEKEVRQHSNTVRLLQSQMAQPDGIKAPNFIPVALMMGKSAIVEVDGERWEVALESDLRHIKVTLPNQTHEITIVIDKSIKAPNDPSNGERDAYASLLRLCEAYKEMNEVANEIASIESEMSRIASVSHNNEESFVEASIAAKTMGQKLAELNRRKLALVPTSVPIWAVWNMPSNPVTIFYDGKPYLIYFSSGKVSVTQSRVTKSFPVVI